MPAPAPVPHPAPNPDPVTPPPAPSVKPDAPPVEPVAPGAGKAGATPPDEKPVKKLDGVMKRRTQTSDEDLRKQLQGVTETGFDQPAAEALYTPIVKAGTQVKNLDADLGPKAFILMANQANRPDMVALPWITGTHSEIGKEAAERLHVLSVNLRAALRKSVKAGDVRPDPDTLRGLLTDDEWTKPEALPTLTQLLQAENTPIRLLLVEMLAKIKGKEASIALAKRAIFDLSAEVREKAVKALADRPQAEYVPVLYVGFRYPWPAAADHAAEAVVTLQRTDLVPELVKLLKEPDPSQPVKVEKKYVVQEVVRINHLCNCMLCHAPSLAKDDLVRGRVPQPGEDPPPLYYQERTGLFVRADLTYIRQDFSVVQPVAHPGKWSGNQRYDYVLRTRPLTKTEQTAYQKVEKENKSPKSYPQQESVLFALRELTGKDYGSTYADWTAGLQKSETQSRTEKPEPQKSDTQKSDQPKSDAQKPEPQKPGMQK
jgi:hypothetical protein